MPRANRHFLPNHVWHLTHRCHKQDFLLKFAKDRRRYLHWLFEARKRFGLRVLNYIVTSNHIHLLVHDKGDGEVASSMQLVAARVAQEYNRRKGRKGAFWEDRYHATAVDTEGYLARCMVYIDLNMVRAGVVAHPQRWPDSGHWELQTSRSRYRIIDAQALMELMGVTEFKRLQQRRAAWVDNELQRGVSRRESCWSEPLAVGSRDFVQGVRGALGLSGRYRQVVEGDEARRYMLRESPPDYTLDSDFKSGVVSAINTVLWDQR